MLPIVDEMRRLYDQLGLELVAWQPGQPERVALLSAQADLIGAIASAEAAEDLCRVIEVELEDEEPEIGELGGWWMQGPEGSN
jgi:hypothetical protein